MTTQSEALRLAAELEAPIGTQTTYATAQQSAAELRRLHNEMRRLEADRRELLEALDNIECSTYESLIAALARAAIAKVEGK